MHNLIDQQQQYRNLKLDLSSSTSYKRSLAWTQISSQEKPQNTDSKVPNQLDSTETQDQLKLSYKENPIGKWNQRSELQRPIVDWVNRQRESREIFRNEPRRGRGWRRDSCWNRGFERSAEAASKSGTCQRRRKEKSAVREECRSRWGHRLGAARPSSPPWLWWQKRVKFRSCELGQMNTIYDWKRQRTKTLLWFLMGFKFL